MSSSKLQLLKGSSTKSSCKLQSKQPAADAALVPVPAAEKQKPLPQLPLLTTKPIVNSLTLNKPEGVNPLDLSWAVNKGILMVYTPENSASASSCGSPSDSAQEQEEEEEGEREAGNCAVGQQINSSAGKNSNSPKPRVKVKVGNVQMQVLQKKQKMNKKPTTGKGKAKHQAEVQNKQKKDHVAGALLLGSNNSGGKMKMMKQKTKTATTPEKKSVPPRAARSAPPKLSKIEPRQFWGLETHGVDDFMDEDEQWDIEEFEALKNVASDAYHAGNNKTVDDADVDAVMAAAYAEAEAATGGTALLAPFSTGGQQPGGQAQGTSSGSSSSSANGTTSNSSTTLASSFQSLLPNWMRDLITGGGNNNTNNASSGGDQHGPSSSSASWNTNNDLFFAGHNYPSEELLHKTNDVSTLLGDDEQGAQQPEPQAPTGGMGTAKNEDEMVISAAWGSSSSTSSFDKAGAAKAEVVGKNNANLVSTSASSASDGDGEQLPLFGKNVNAKTLNCFDSKNGDHVLGRTAGAVVKSTTSVDVEQKLGNKDLLLGVTAAAAAANDESKAVQQELMQLPATSKAMAKEQKVKQGKAMKKAATSSTSVAAVIETTTSSCLLPAPGGAAAGPDEVVSSKGRGAKSKTVKAETIGTTKKPAVAIVRKGPEAKDVARKMRQAASSCSSTTGAAAAKETQTMPKSKSKTKNKQVKDEIASAKHYLQADSGPVGLHQKKTKTKSTATIKPASSTSGGTKGNKKTSPEADGTAEPNTGSGPCAAAKKRKLRSK
ncbi:unnamed protein product [Amoebophrya sp. A120]|nr:unnamed protein product [Amoebophrya sp. A120]|eukprot:GSA120T00013661001.1